MGSIKFKDGSHDADIFLNWKERKVEFTNQRGVFNNPKRTFGFLLSTWVFGFLFFYYLGGPFLSIVEMGALAFAFPAYLVGGDYLSAKLQVSSFKTKQRLTKRPYTVKIINPYGKIIYDCKYNEAPLVDLLFDENVSQKLIAVSMVEIPRQKTRFNFLQSTPTRKTMVLTLDGQAQGNLTIQEYR